MDEDSTYMDMKALRKKQKTEINAPTVQKVVKPKKAKTEEQKIAAEKKKQNKVIKD